MRKDQTPFIDSVLVNGEDRGLHLNPCCSLLSSHGMKRNEAHDPKPLNHEFRELYWFL